MKIALGRRTRHFDRDERGSVFLVVGAFLVLLLFVGMAVDFGILLRYRRAMQNACDSAVLAGAQNLRNGSTTPQNEATTYMGRDLTENNIAWNSANFSVETQDKNGKATGTNPVRLAASYQVSVPLFFLASVTPSVTVQVQCAAQRVPILTTGLDPFGMDYTQFSTIWTQLNGCTSSNNTAGCFTGCPLIGASLSGLSPSQQTVCGQDYNLTVSTSGSNWGGGNTGTLQLLNSVCGGPNGANGASYFSCLMYNGSGSSTGGTPPPPYCANTLSAAGTGNTPYPACSIVFPSPGESIGSGSQVNPPSSYGTGLRGGVASICSTPNPLTDLSASKWVVILPLLDPANWGNGTANGSSAQQDIVGFTAFELDCPALANMTINGQTAQLPGRFVAVLNGQAVAGNPNGVDTGVDTIILVQ